ncbi:MAG: hypothetical protein IJ240_04145 [Clostridia bacterium]|nr:hypothetical protein [Clostridia bacterium]
MNNAIDAAFAMMVRSGYTASRETATLDISLSAVDMELPDGRVKTVMQPRVKYKAKAKVISGDLEVGQGSENTENGLYRKENGDIGIVRLNEQMKIT